MKILCVVIFPILFFLGCDSIGFGGSYPSIYSKHVPECGCDGVMYIIYNPNQSMQKVTLVRTRISGTSPAKRKTIKMLLQPKVEKKLGCSEINLYITGRSQYCDTHQSFYVKKYKELKRK
ncbi:hypothetical protein JHD50_11825 [Sulfurimonas sp. MAG313]|nr:hypothetical protein [Sulfurimonas sp. MAG313]MDF1881977.1 hypothetical protein [Sulfurimonas sp. MAG313]